MSGVVAVVVVVVLGWRRDIGGGWLVGVCRYGK